MNQPFISFAFGGLLLLIATGAVAGGARSLVRSLLPRWDTAPRMLATTVVALATMVGVCQVVGALGWFSKLPILVALVGAGAGLWRASRLPARRVASTADEPAEATSAAGAGVATPPIEHLPALSGAFAIVGIIAVSAEWGQRTWWTLTHGIHSIDSNWYHLPVAARWVQTGSITPLHYLETEPLTTFFPANGSIFHALGMLFLDTDLLSVFINLGWLALALLAAWCIGRPFGASRLATGAAAIALATPSLVATQPGGGYSDTAGIALVLAAVGILVNAREADRHTTRATLIIAAAATGLAMGTKFQFLVPTAALTLGAIYVAPQGRRVRHALLWCTTLALTGGFWYLRNWILVGNPLPASTIHLGPIHLRKVPLKSEFTTFADHMTSRAAWEDWFLKGFDRGIGGLWWLLLGGLVAIVVVGLVRGGRHTQMVCFVGGATLGGFVVTPALMGYGTRLVWFGVALRYLAPGIVLCAVAAAVVAGERPPAWRWITMGMLASYLLALQMEASDWEEPLEMLLDQPFWQPVSLTWIAIATALVAATIAASRMLRSAGPARLTMVVIAALALLGVAMVPVRRTFLRHRYERPYGALGLVDHGWSLRLRNERIGFFDLPLQYPMYGPDQSNHVQLLGERQPGGGWTPIASCDQWRTAINDASLTYVALLRTIDEGVAEPQRIWTETDPAAELVQDTRSARVFRIHGPMDPGGCETAESPGRPAG